MEFGAQSIELVSSEDLAVAFGFAAPHDAFRGFCRNLGIAPVRRNPNFYDPKHVRIRLDQAQGLSLENTEKTAEKSYVKQRRERRGAA